jgi:hypothetical protein
MRKSLSARDLGFRARGRRRLSKALERTTEVRFFRRIQAVWLGATGKSFAEVAQITMLSLRSVYRLVRRYLNSHRVEDLADRPRRGRPLATRRSSARTLALLTDMDQSVFRIKALNTP